MNDDSIEANLKKINAKIDSIKTQDLTEIEETIKEREINICTPIFESIKQKINKIPPENHLEIQLEIINLQKEHIELLSEFIDTETDDDEKLKENQ